MTSVFICIKIMGDEEKAMSNILDYVIKVQSCRRLESGTAEYDDQREYAPKVKEKFYVSDDVIENICLLHTYQYNGLCSINWQRWFMIPKEQTKNIISGIQQYIQRIRELNPEITAGIDEALGMKPRRVPENRKGRANLLDGVIKIQACDTVKWETAEFNMLYHMKERVRAKFDLSRELRINIYILHFYRLNGMCLIDWNKWYKIPKEETINLIADSQEYIKEIRELNPVISALVDEAIGLEPRDSQEK